MNKFRSKKATFNKTGKSFLNKRKTVSRTPSRAPSRSRALYNPGPASNPFSLVGDGKAASQAVLLHTPQNSMSFSKYSQGVKGSIIDALEAFHGRPKGDFHFIPCSYINSITAIQGGLVLQVALSANKTYDIDTIIRQSPQFQMMAGVFQHFYPISFAMRLAPSSQTTISAGLSSITGVSASYTCADPFQITYDNNPADYTAYVNNCNTMWLPIGTTPPGGKGYHKFKHRVFTTATQYNTIGQATINSLGTLHVVNPQALGGSNLVAINFSNTQYVVQFVFKLYFWDYYMPVAGRILNVPNDAGLGPIEMDIFRRFQNLRVSGSNINEEFKDL